MMQYGVLWAQILLCCYHPGIRLAYHLLFFTACSILKGSLNGYVQYTL